MSISRPGDNVRVNGEDEDMDDFVVLDTPLNLATRPKRPSPEDAPMPVTTKRQLVATPSIDLNPLLDTNSFLISILPPAKPVADIKHVPCDIVLVIDVSGSMAELAPLPDAENDEESESSDLTVLDLVRHACRTIISTLNENDRLALVTFSQDAKVIQALTSMTSEAKDDILAKVEKLKDEGATNLWAGIRTGLQQFETHAPIGNVQGLYVLTDGQPNYMCPSQGYIPKMKPILQSLFESNGSAPTIQTFGFGYSIRSDLMLSIAKVGHGNYAFIPEVGMIGTVFVHAVANLYSTYATNVVLELNTPHANATYLSHGSGLYVKRSGSRVLHIKLGNLQYGQSRDLVVNYAANGLKSGQYVNAKLVYTPHGGSEEAVDLNLSFKKTTSLPQSALDYHMLRNEICKFFWELYPTDPIKEQHITAPTETVKLILPKFNALAKSITSLSNHNSDPNLSSLLSDLVGSQLNPDVPDQGQVYQALQTDPQTKGNRVFKSYWQKWGRHYLSSLWCAHMRQTCNSFKDPGPLRYGVNSDLFKRCRDELDTAFDNLPAPVGTYTGNQHAPSPPYGGGGGMYIPAASRSPGSLPRKVSDKRFFSMRRYNRADNACILGTCPVTMADGQTKAIQDLRLGDKIYSPLTASPRKVIGILRGINPGPDAEICRVGSDLWITPYHPIFHAESATWVFPRDVAEETRRLEAHEHVYSVLLVSRNHDSHAIEVDGIPCVTLGHGLTPSAWQNEADDIRYHAFFGDHVLVREHLQRLSTDEHGRWLCAGVLRDITTGLVCGLLGPDSEFEVDVFGEETGLSVERGEEVMLRARL